MSHDKELRTRRAYGLLPQLLGQVLRFNVVGVVNTAIDFGVFFILDRLGMAYLLAQACSYGCGIANSYLGNKYWTFGLNSSRGRELLRFVSVNLAVLACSVMLIYLFHSLLHLSLTAAKVIATFITMVVNFTVSKIWVFRPETGATAPEVK